MKLKYYLIIQNLILCVVPLLFLIFEALTSFKGSIFRMHFFGLHDSYMGFFNGRFPMSFLSDGFLGSGIALQVIFLLVKLSLFNFLFFKIHNHGVGIGISIVFNLVFAVVCAFDVLVYLRLV